MLLMAFAIENLCKGALIRDGKVDASAWTGDRLPREINTHELRRLVRMVGMSVDEVDEYLLARLQRAAVWSGRYPVAAAYHPSIHTVHAEDGRKYNAASYGRADVERAAALIAKIRTHVRVRRRYTTSRDAVP